MSELKIVGRHASTVLVGQLASIAFGVADTVIAGRYSDDALAALSVGAALYISVYVSLMGVVQALLPIWAEMLGGKRFADVGRSLRQSFYLCALLVVIGMAILLFPGPLLRAAAVPGPMREEVEHYLLVLAFAFPPALLFRLYSTFNQSLGKPRLVTWLQVAALGVKIPLSIWLVAGGLGVEPMGAAGCAWATLVVNYLLLGLGVWMLRTRPLYQPFGLWRRLEAPDWTQIGHFARLGVPAGLSYLIEVTSFTLMALFIARLGTVAAASHQIAASMAAVLYMVPLSVAISCSSRVSFWLGAGNAVQARRVVVLSLRLTGLAALVSSAVLLVARQTIAGWYSASPEVVAFASALLLWVALYHLADATQCLCAFLLRCYRITIGPLILYGVLLWGLGLWGGYRLAYYGIAGVMGGVASQSATSFWQATTAALALVAVCMLALLWRAVRRPQAA